MQPHWQYVAIVTLSVGGSCFQQPPSQLFAPDAQAVEGDAGARAAHDAATTPQTADASLADASVALDAQAFLADAMVAPPPPAIQFEDTSASLEVPQNQVFATKDTYHVSGQAWADVNGDGWLDLYLTTSVGTNTLYQNNADGTFSVSPVSSHVSLDQHASGGAVFADFDNDGWRDLYVLGLGENVLYRNLEGKGFADVTDAAGVGDPGMGETAAWGDYDGDGDLDLYVCNWRRLALGDGAEATSDGLYRNNADGTFTDIRSVLGNSGTGLCYAASFLDYDNDGDLDLYVVNDKGFAGADTTPLNRNALLRNDGPGDGTSPWNFTDVSLATGADARVYGMGVAIGDFDHNGRLDLAFSDGDAALRLYRNQETGFEDVTAAAGVEYLLSDGWGSSFVDLDADGWLDIYATSGGALGGARTWRNQGDGTFEDLSVASGGNLVGTVRGTAVADYDRDGRPDLVVGENNSPYHLLRNVSEPDHHWLSVRLEGAGAVNRDAVGARAIVTRSDGLVMMQEVKIGSSLGSGSDTALFFGLGSEDVTSVVLRWPNGVEQTVAGVVRDRELAVRYVP